MFRKLRLCARHHLIVLQEPPGPVHSCPVVQHTPRQQFAPGGQQIDMMTPSGPGELQGTRPCLQATQAPLRHCWPARQQVSPHTRSLGQQIRLSMQRLSPPQQALLQQTSNGPQHWPAHTWLGGWQQKSLIHGTSCGQHVPPQSLNWLFGPQQTLLWRQSESSGQQASPHRLVLAGQQIWKAGSAHVCPDGQQVFPHRGPLSIGQQKP
jgi:hypothetical protein